MTIGQKTCREADAAEQDRAVANGTASEERRRTDRAYLATAMAATRAMTFRSSRNFQWQQQSQYPGKHIGSKEDHEHPCGSKSGSSGQYPCQWRSFAAVSSNVAKPWIVTGRLDGGASNGKQTGGGGATGMVKISHKPANLLKLSIRRFAGNIRVFALLMIKVRKQRVGWFRLALMLGLGTVFVVRHAG
jgi:hypothetical protein